MPKVPQVAPKIPQGSEPKVPVPQGNPEFVKGKFGVQWPTGPRSETLLGLWKLVVLDGVLVWLFCVML